MCQTDRMNAMSPSGRQYEISAGDYAAVVVEVGGGLRELSCGRRALIDGYPGDAVPDGSRGQVLAPWPNRLRDGKWSWDGEDLQLPVDEVMYRNAIHGLVRWAGWTLESHGVQRAVLSYRLHPQPGYPFTVDFRVEYTVDRHAGLTVELSATNPGATCVPVALGMHPYLLPPTSRPLDECTILIPAGKRALVDARGIPQSTESVEGTSHDFRAARRIDGHVLDTAYTDLTPDSDDLVRVVLLTEDGSGTEFWTESTTKWLQVYTGDTLALGVRRRSIAVEPMTAPPNALASGDDVMVLEPGRSLSLRWGLRHRG